MMDIRDIFWYMILVCIVKESIQKCVTSGSYYQSTLQCENLTTPTDLPDVSTSQGYSYRQIAITNSSFTNLNANSFNSPRVSIIKITRTALRTIEPSGFNNLPELANLYLSNNNISTITRGIFNHLTKLKTLNLSDNTIQLIEDNSFLGTKINELYLHGNKIEDITSIIVNCDSYRILDLSSNAIGILSPLRNCSILQTLRISNNHIVQLKNNHLPRSLINLYLGNNRIESIEVETFTGMTKLVELDLSNNQLYKASEGFIPLGMLQNLVALKYLNVSHNGLSSILPGTFTRLNSLHTLDLGYNNLTHLPTGLLRQLPLTFFSIRNNMIKELENNCFKPTSGVTINLDGNKWTCDYLSNKIHQILALNKLNTIISGDHINTPNINGVKCNPTEPNIAVDGSTYANSSGILKMIASNIEDLEADHEETNNLLFDIKGLLNNITLLIVKDIQPFQKTNNETDNLLPDIKDLLNNITLLKVKDLQQFQKTNNETDNQLSDLTQAVLLDFKDLLNNMTISIAERTKESSDEGTPQLRKSITSHIQQFQENSTTNAALSGDQANSDLSAIRVLLLSILLSILALIGLILAALAFIIYKYKSNANTRIHQDTLLDTYS